MNKERMFIEYDKNTKEIIGFYSDLVHGIDYLNKMDNILEITENQYNEIYEHLNQEKKCIVAHYEAKKLLNYKTKIKEDIDRIESKSDAYLYMNNLKSEKLSKGYEFKNNKYDCDVKDLDNLKRVYDTSVMFDQEYIDIRTYDNRMVKLSLKDLKELIFNIFKYQQNILKLYWEYKDKIEKLEDNDINNIRILFREYKDKIKLIEE